jgi:hypothetical protein
LLGADELRVEPGEVDAVRARDRIAQLVCVDVCPPLTAQGEALMGRLPWPMSDRVGSDLADCAADQVVVAPAGEEERAEPVAGDTVAVVARSAVAVILGAAAFA